MTFRFANLFRRGSTMAKADRRLIPPGERVYAIGDIHGRDDLFAELVEQIVADDHARAVADTTLILLGDLVDRGPDSKAVVERAMRLSEPFKEVRRIIGNHEECFLAALSGDVSRLRYFARIGGDATLRSYMPDKAAYEAFSFEDLAAVIADMVPAAHVNFLASGEDIIAIGDYVFVHAGVRAGVPLDNQAVGDLRWIREEFLRQRVDFGAMVVHGHSVTVEVDERPNRIGIDTGAFASGRLTAIGLEGADRWYLSTGTAAAH